MAIAAEVSDEGMVADEAIAVSDVVLVELSVLEVAPSVLVVSVPELLQAPRLSKPMQEADNRIRFIGEGL